MLLFDIEEPGKLPVISFEPVDIASIIAVNQSLDAESEQLADTENAQVRLADDSVVRIGFAVTVL